MPSLTDAQVEDMILQLDIHGHGGSADVEKRAAKSARSAPTFGDEVGEDSTGRNGLSA